jgi:glycine/D-amino acid oxidase-like deaminating enzyme
VHVVDPATAVPAVEAVSLPESIHADVCIAGATLPALIAAYMLVRAQRDVVVLEPYALGAIEPGIGTVRMSSLPDRGYGEQHASEGAEALRNATRTHGAALDALEALVRRERIACEFERLDAYWRVEGGLAGAQREHAAAREAGIGDTELVEALAVPEGTWGPVLRFPGQARLQPLKLVHGLARAIARAGGRILLGVTPVSLEAGETPTVITAGGQHVSADVVVAAHAPTCGARLEAVAAPRIAHVVGVHVARGSLPQALYRDARPFAIDASLLSHGRGAGEVLLVGGEDPPGDDDHTAFRYLALEHWAREHFPAAGMTVHRGTVQALPEHDLFACGAGAAEGLRAAARGGSALTRAMLAALAIADFVQGVDSTWSELYLHGAARA